MEKIYLENSDFIDTEAVKALGDRVEKEARQANYDEEIFCEIASTALESFDGEIRFDPIAIGRFLSSTAVPQKAFLSFSDLPITLFSNRNFYIEALCWFTASTAIHSHGFCGAFKVGAGSSLHSKYKFTTESRMSSKAVAGSLECLSSELLTKDSIRQIRGGNDGLVHSLFHIEQPSISLLIRSHSSAHFQPQCVFHPPGLALDSFALAKDPETRLVSRLITVCATHKPDRLGQLLEAKVRDLDFARLSWISLENPVAQHSKLDQEKFWDCVNEKHGRDGDLLRAACCKRDSKQRLQNLRSLTDDRDLRYFLACLLNAPNRRILMEILKDGRPDRDPVEFIATSITRLSNLAPNPRKLLEEMSNWQNHARYSIPAQLAPILGESGSKNESSESSLLKIIRRDINGKIGHLSADEKAKLDRLSHFPEFAPIWDFS